VNEGALAHWGAVAPLKKRKKNIYFLTAVFFRIKFFSDVTLCVWASGLQGLEEFPCSYLQEVMNSSKCIYLYFRTYCAGVMLNQV